MNPLRFPRGASARRRAALALGALLALAVPAGAQTYRDSGGTIVPGVVPLGGCVAGGNCAGPMGAGAAIYSGQQTCAASAAALPSQTLANGVVVTAKSTNTGTVYVGPLGVTSSTGYPLAAGQSISYAVANLSSVYIVDSVTTDAVAFTGN